MFSKPLKRLKRKTAFRLTARYTFLYSLSSLLLFIIAYVLLSWVVREQDRRLLLEKINEYSYIERNRGASALVDFVRRDAEDDEDSDFFVRVESPSGAELFVLIPQGWKPLPSDLFDKRSSERFQWVQWRPKDASDFYEFAVKRLPDGVVLFVGGDAKEREDLLSQFQKIFAGITVTVVFIGLVVGALLANRALSPIRDLIATVQSIELGSMDARVPMRQGESELVELARLFNSMLDRISTLIRGMRDALDNVAHDLRTPATRARAVIETALAQSGDDKEALREALMDCAEETERIMTMLTALMDISEAETGTMRLYKERLDVADLIEESAELYEDLAQERGVTLVTDSPAGLFAMADPTRIRQVLANLLDNALKYSCPGGKVELRGRLEGGDVRVSVRDEGEGIPPEDIPRIFDRLFRGDKSRTHRGLGLGLSLVRAVLKAHGGEIGVESEVGRGSCFTFTLPGAGGLSGPA
ncbi:hypothetical protein JCM15519_34280 [Fundidesulfovibrio butyratiphilus]